MSICQPRPCARGRQCLHRGCGFLCHELGIETGIDLEKLNLASRRAEEIIGSTLMGRVMHSDGLDQHRSRSN